MLNCGCCSLLRILLKVNKRFVVPESIMNQYSCIKYVRKEDCLVSFPTLTLGIVKLVGQQP